MAMYKVGDCVYFETSSTTPYQVRRIEELCKTSSGNVEAKVMCFYRRRDLPSFLIGLADKHQSGTDDEGDNVSNPEKEDLSETQKYQLKHRELFLSRQVETLPATHIRGKCSITLLNETEQLSSYLRNEDVFFYSLVYDPQGKTLLADKGEIRVGTRYQADPTPLLEEGEPDGRDLSDLEELIWNPDSGLQDKQIENFQMLARSVGTFARSLDCTNTVRQPSLHISAAYASRDITLFHAMDLLHKHDYDVPKAVLDLCPNSGPVLCRDEMEEWSASEANLFEEALDKYGKDFGEITQDFLPWKSMKSMVEYYYMWKTTDRYVQQKRIKAAETESRLKQVYIPNYNKANPAQINDKVNGIDSFSQKLCESCYTSNSSQWYSWGPAHMQCRVCSSCWIYFKKYGGLKMATRIEGNNGPLDRHSLQLNTSPRVFRCTHAPCTKMDFKSKAHFIQHLANVHGLAMRAGSPNPIMKTRAAFCLITTPLTRISRQICKGILDIHRSARRPFQPINIALIKQEYQQHLPQLVNKLRILKSKNRDSVDQVSARLGIDVSMEKPSLLLRMGDNRQATSAFTMPQNDAQELVSSVAGQKQLTPSSKKRGYEHINGNEDGPSHKVKSTAGLVHQTTNVKQMQPKMRGATVNRLNGSGISKSQAANRARRHMLSWMDTPDDLLFVATDAIRKLRKQMSLVEMKRGARKPWQTLSARITKNAESSVVILD